MKKIATLLFFTSLLSAGTHSQLMVSKLIGKNANNAKLGYGTFTFLDFPLKNADNQSIRIEILDFAYYPQKSSDIDNTIGYVSIKGGYKYVFSEGQTGFYVEPSAGYCRVVASNNLDPLAKFYGDGFALALEGGYSLGVGQGDNAINFALKYETDQTGDFVANSVAFRVSFSFHLFRRRDS